MAKVIRCKDAGMQCDWVGMADTEEEVLKKAGEHLKQVHNTEMTPEVMAKARSIIHDE